MQTTTTYVSPTLFRAYDIRGVVNETLTEDVVYLIGLAIGSQARASGQQKIVIGRDGRHSGPALSEALSKGLLATGCDVIDVGALPTPTLYFAACHETGSGVMITGSHNPPDYNGLKIMIGGETLSGNKITALYDRIIKNDFQIASQTGTYSQKAPINDYIDAICQRIQLKKPLKIVIDCGNGIPGAIAPTLFEKLGATVIPLFCEVDGNFPNHHPDPAHPKNLIDLQKAVKEHQADIGLAFDGDGDRLGAITELGEIIWPDRLLMLFARDVLSRVPQATIIYDVKCSHLLENIIRENNGNPYMWRTGHSLIKAKMKEIKAPLAGEMSGHFFFGERWFGFDDGLYSGARLLEILTQSTMTFHEMVAQLPHCITTPEMHVTVSEENKFKLIDQLTSQLQSHQDAKITTIDGIRMDFEYGWGLVRASNTTPVLVTRFEADDEAGLDKIKQLFREAIQKTDKNLVIPF
jgi:phosphomannomutase/phosphoglucomutase